MTKFLVGLLALMSFSTFANSNISCRIVNQITNKNMGSCEVGGNSFFESSCDIAILKVQNNRILVSLTQGSAVMIPDGNGGFTVPQDDIAQVILRDMDNNYSFEEQKLINPGDLSVEDSEISLLLLENQYRVQCKIV